MTSEIKEETSGEVIQAFQVVRKHFFANGVQVAFRLVRMRDNLMKLTVKKKRRDLSQDEINNSKVEFAQILSDRQIADFFPEFHDRLDEISNLVENGWFARALGQLHNMLTPPTSVPPSPLPTIEMLEEPPVLLLA